MFTKELEAALLDKRVRFVVHSLKDMPTTLPVGLCIGAILERASPLDAVVMASRHRDLYHSIQDLPRGSVIGTSSVRRKAQLTRAYPHLQFKDVRGNLNTRLSKLDSDDNAYDALVLAYAGMYRMGWHSRITHSLSTDVCMYAVGQGALAVECRDDDVEILDMLSTLIHPTTEKETIAERTVMRELEGGCSVPIGVASVWTSDYSTMELSAVVSSLDGSKILTAKRSLVVESISDAQELGSQVARQLLKEGASQLLAQCRE